MVSRKICCVKFYTIMYKQTFSNLTDEQIEHYEVKLVLVLIVLCTRELTI